MSNPLMSEWMYKEVWSWTWWDVMTIDWTLNKSFILLSITVLSAIWIWSYSDLFMPYMLPIIILSSITAFIIIFFKKTAPYLAVLYAVLEGVFIWVISSYYDLMFPWIVMQAVSLTFGVFFIMLYIYKAKIISVDENFKSWLIAATWAIALIYIISILWSLTWWYAVPYIHESWFIGIAFSIFVVWIAALNLILDFDNVEKWVANRAPKYMEWYTSFWLLVTLVWLYLEILRLLAKTRD